MAKRGVFKSNINKINKEINDGIIRNQAKAAKLLVKELKSAVGDEYFEGKHSAPGEPPGKDSGDLQKGIGYATDRHAREIETQVGFHRPAYHAHLMEFGTDPRYQETTTTKKSGKIALKKPRFVGKVEKRPFFVPTLMKNLDNVKAILSEEVL